MTVKEYRLAAWEYFEAQIDADGTRALITHVRTVDQGDGHIRIHGDGTLHDPEAAKFFSVQNAWLRPEDVPARVIRGDAHWPRIHPLEARKMCQRRPEAYAVPVDEDGEEIVVPELPKPEVRARPATLEEIPQGARTVGNRAKAAGFVQRATYARGPWTNNKGALIEISDCIMLKGRHDDGRRYVAMWVTRTGVKGQKAGVVEWKFQFSYVWNREGVVIRCNATELSEYLARSHS